MMTWTNYRNIVERFHHIDADFVRSTTTMSSGGGTAELTVRFYPWWEHPRYLSARDRGEDWGFASYEAGKREVTVRAIRPWAVRLSPRQEVVDWGFEEEHPGLWDFAERSTIFANATFDGDAFFVGLVKLGLRNVSEGDLRRSIHLPDPGNAPMAVTMPAQLHEPVLTVFHHLGVPVFSPGPPRTPRAAVIFLIDDDDYIVAEDFEVDVPEFVHAPEWFQPAG